MTQQEIFEVVKYFKSIYTKVNLQDEIYLVGKSEKEANLFYKGEMYYLLYGKIKSEEDNVFLTWLKNKSVKIKISDMDSLRNCLKKNVLDLSTTDSDFSLKYTLKDGTETTFKCINEEDESFEAVKDKITKIEGILTNKHDLDVSYFDRDVLEIYSKKDGFTTDRNGDKLIEFPIKRILSYQKESSHVLSFSDKDENKKRYVMISSDNSVLSLSQIFATI
jgi:hypothetical protein